MADQDTINTTERTDPVEEHAAPPQPILEKKTITATLRNQKGQYIPAVLTALTALTLAVVLIISLTQLTYHLRNPVPRELKITRPAPALWKEITAKTPGSHPLAVPEGLAQITELRMGAPAVPEPVPAETGNR